jgi:hypothetical protein
MPIQSSAILLFSRTASAEAATKGFGAGGAGKRITSALIDRTVATLAQTDLAVFRSDESKQVGTTFGERLTNAITAVFDQGVERLMIVGNDCPQLTPSHLRAAAQLLEKGHNVIGPDRRGGTWLIGLQRADFNATLFAELPWESEFLYAELARSLPARIDVASLGDLNTFEDLSQQWFLLRRQLSELFDLLLISETAFGLEAEARETTAVFRRLGRAPPVGEHSLA